MNEQEATAPETSSEKTPRNYYLIGHFDANGALVTDTCESLKDLRHRTESIEASKIVFVWKGREIKPKFQTRMTF